jgi:hypothetical protein
VAGLRETPLDRKSLERHLALAERNLALGEKHIQRQRGLIADLERDAQDATGARVLLVTLEATQALHFADRDLLRQELNLFRQELKKIW